MDAPERFRVTIVVRPQRAELLCQRLLAAGLVDAMTAAECRGYGRQKGHLADYGGGEYQIEFLPKVAIEGLVAAADVERLVELVCATARTGRIGDGKILLVPVGQDAGL